MFDVLYWSDRSALVKYISLGLLSTRATDAMSNVMDLILFLDSTLLVFVEQVQSASTNLQTKRQNYVLDNGHASIETFLV